MRETAGHRERLCRARLESAPSSAVLRDQALDDLKEGHARVA
jgi:hypothetical protein